jgi:hypothetical protein
LVFAPASPFLAADMLILVVIMADESPYITKAHVQSLLTGGYEWLWSLTEPSAQPSHAQPSHAKNAGRSSAQPSAQTQPMTDAQEPISHFDSAQMQPTIDTPEPSFHVNFDSPQSEPPPEMPVAPKRYHGDQVESTREYPNGNSHYSTISSKKI